MIIDTSKQGIEKFMGKTESLIMQYVWKNGSMTVKEFCLQYKDFHPNTITTIANRMVKKNLLKKEKGIKSFRYTSVKSETLFISDIKKELQSLLKQL